MPRGKREITADGLTEVIDRALISKNPANSVRLLRALGENVPRDPSSKRYARTRLGGYKRELLAPPNDENN